jgi:MFS family permease
LAKPKGERTQDDNDDAFNSKKSDDNSSRRYKIIALGIIMMGVMMSAVDTTAVVLALPVMMNDLHSDIVNMIWVIISYLLVITILGTQVGRLGDMYGRARIYNLGFAIFTAGSLACGLSATGLELIFFRVLQGLGGALISSNSGAMVADTFPENARGKAFGFTAIGWSIGAIVGILIGGAFVTFLNWRYIFFINLPIGIIATLVGYITLQNKQQKQQQQQTISSLSSLPSDPKADRRRKLEEERITRKGHDRLHQKVNVLDMSVLGIGLFLILYALTQVASSGPSSLLVYVEMAGGAAALATFRILEGRMSSPSIDLSLFQNRVLTASMVAAFLQALASYAVIFLIIIYLQGPREMSPFDASMLLIPGYVMGGIAAPFAGKFTDKLGARVVATIGLALQIVGIFVYASLATDSPLYFVVAGAVLNGIGASMFYPANTNAVMASTSKRGSYGVASGVLRTLSNTGMVASFAVALFVASLSIPRQMAFSIFLGIVNQISGQLSKAYVNGMHSALITSISLLAGALVLSVLRGRESAT